MFTRHEYTIMNTCIPTKNNDISAVELQTIKANNAKKANASIREVSGKQYKTKLVVSSRTSFLRVNRHLITVTLDPQSFWSVGRLLGIILRRRLHITIAI